MFDLVWMFIKNPMTLFVIFAAVVVLAGIFFAAGPKAVLKLLVEPRLWLIGLLAAGMLGYQHLAKENADLKAKVEQQASIDRAHDDALKAIRSRQSRQKERQRQSDRLTGVIDDAEPGTAYDAVLDEIDAIQKGGTAAPDGVAKLPAPDGMPVQPDGVVRP